MVDRRPDEHAPLLDALRALSDLGVAHVSDDEAAARVDARPAPTAAARPFARRAPRGFARRPLLLALLAVVTTGTAAAAGLGLIGGPSAPLHGPLPAAAVSERRVVADHYRLSLFPTLTIGETGWCLTETLTADGRPHGGGSACGPAAPATMPLIAGLSGSVDAGESDTQLASNVVDARIAGLRLHDGSVVQARADPALPDGFRSLVVIQDHPRKSRYLGPDGLAARAYYDAPSGKQPERQPFRDTARRAPSRACRIRAADGSVVRVVSARELRRLPHSTPGLNGRPFLSCATARVTFGGRSYVAAVLVDATDPSARAARLPHATPRDGARVRVPGDIGRAPTDARRVGRGWLLVQGPDAPGRRAVLDALETR